MQPLKFQNPHSPSTLMMFYFAFSCCDKPPMKSSKQLAGAFVSAYKFQSITERSQSRISRQEPGGRSWGRDHREVLLTVLLLADCSTTLFTPIYMLRSRTTHSWLGHPTSISNCQSPHKHAHRAIWWRQFHTWGHSSQACLDFDKLRKKIYHVWHAGSCSPLICAPKIVLDKH